MESARGPQLKIPSPSLSSASKGEQRPPPPSKIEETLNVSIAENEVKASSAPPKMSDKGRNVKVPDVSEATRESMSVREPASQGSALLADEEVQQKMASGEAGIWHLHSMKILVDLIGDSIHVAFVLPFH